MTMVPLRFRPMYKEKIWGGRRLGDVCGRTIPAGKRIGESWEIADHGDDVSIIEGGPWGGLPLREIIRENAEEILGTSPAVRRSDRFPLLVKLIDAAEDLSIQVHPPDCYAEKHEGREWGKTELWYVMSAEEGAVLWCGFEGAADPQSFGRALDEGRVAACLRRISVRAGDAVFVPAGRVHSIGAGNLILEIEENSDVTYRLYDWGRAPAGRTLHRDKALDVIDFRDLADPRIERRWGEGEGFRTALLVRCRYFRVEEVEIDRRWESACRGERFRIISVVRGSGALVHGGGRGEIVLSAGDNILLPAALGAYAVRAGAGGCTLLQTEVP